MDCSSLRFRGKLTVDTVDAAARLAAPDLSCLLSRVKVTLGSTVIYDGERQDIASAFLTNLEVTNESANSFENYLRDHPTELSVRSSQVLTAATAGRTVMFSLSPRGTLLNSQSLIPLEQLKAPIHIGERSLFFSFFYLLLFFVVSFFCHFHFIYLLYFCFYIVQICTGTTRTRALNRPTRRSPTQ
jgi:hypothetical protein